MQPPESAPGSGDSELSESAIRNLRDQVAQLEIATLARQVLLEECRERLAMFENAANERLHVIEKGDTLLRRQAEKIAALQRESGELREELESLRLKRAEERDRLERACEEAARGMVELAKRERTLTAETLELRNEGLIHSIIRRLRSLLS